MWDTCHWCAIDEARDDMDITAICTSRLKEEAVLTTIATAVEFEALVRMRGDSAVLTFTGTMDRNSLARTVRAIEVALAAAPRRVIADVTAARLTEAGVGLLALLARRVVREELRFAVIADSTEQVRRLRETRIGPPLEIYPSVPIALGAIGTW